MNLKYHFNVMYYWYKRVATQSTWLETVKEIYYDAILPLIESSYESIRHIVIILIGFFYIIFWPFRFLLVIIGYILLPRSRRSMRMAFANHIHEQNKKKNKV